ncbi:symbiosis island integrase [Sphingomonas sp. MM-1]|uniref:tyrosine-type recombinase/integrase n=1 Tax=Sphingomonas sp. MM-1 TaxID=745310 RepID=UPI0002C10893|nr:integrase arm-type DNA-binding domain-containing protein [Sphingomonas sp. MM-1]AGH50316.1 symbiosis island integrase [Sphingomonas sp. MM-1]
MALKDTEIRAFRPLDKPYRKADSGGLYLEVFPNGSKLWRWKFRIAGKEKRLALGAYPAVSLKEARATRDDEKAKLLKGVDPALDRKRGKVAAKISAANTFAAVAHEYIDTKMVGESRADATISKARWFLEQLEPAIGKMPIAEVDQQMLLAALMRVQMRGRYETAKKCRSFASRVFRYGVVTGRCASDPAHLLQGALTTPQAKHYAAILEPAKLGELLRAIDTFTGSPVTKAALQIAPHVFVRPGELRHAEWAEFNLEEGIWNLPAAKMKARRPHAVPLSRQVKQMLVELRTLTGSGKYVFPSANGPSRPMSENTLNASFRRMGFDKDEVTAHGLRATASTLLNQSGLWNPDAIERALAHGESNATRGAYHRGLYWDERVRMAQWWSDYLDERHVSK